MLTLDRISKSFFGAPALIEVSVALSEGRTLGLVGENGAGKSTLMNILGGNLHPDRGTMTLQGTPFLPRSPRDAETRGIAFIHQELNLFPNLSIAENCFVSGFPRRWRHLPWTDRATMRRQTRERLQQVRLDRSPDTLVEHLSPGERQLVEIAKALNQEARIMIFDEPTTSLSDHESLHLFSIIRQLRARGMTMVYISHNLNHVMDLSDDLLVLRDGQVVGHGSRPSFDIDRLVTLMVGRTIDTLFPKRTHAVSEEVLFEARQVMQRGVVESVDLCLHRGEVLGLSGLVGAGRSELAHLLFGLAPCHSGEVRLEGENLTALSPRERIRRGLAFLPEDRRVDGLCMEGTIGDNIILPTLPNHSRPPLWQLQEQAMNEAIGEARQAVQITASAHNRHAVKSLSGGNQQKVVFGKWLLTRPKVFILDEPTRGIDIAAKLKVYDLINQLAEQGAGILMISSEIEELLGMCDRILVMRRGRIQDTFRASEFNRETILRAALHDDTAPPASTGDATS